MIDNLTKWSLDWNEWNALALDSNDNGAWLARRVHPQGGGESTPLFFGEPLAELFEGRGVEQPPEHHIEDVFSHCVSAYRYALTQGWKHIAWAALLHDIGKARAQKKSPEGNITFHKHEVLSEKMAWSLLVRLGAPEREAARICGLVRNHMYHYTSDTWALFEGEVEVEKTRCGSPEGALLLPQFKKGLTARKVCSGWKDSTVRRFAVANGIADLGEEKLRGEHLSRHPLFLLREADRGSRGFEPRTKKQEQFEERLRKVLLGTD